MDARSRSATAGSVGYRSMLFGEGPAGRRPSVRRVRSFLLRGKHRAREGADKHGPRWGRAFRTAERNGSADATIQDRHGDRGRDRRRRRNSRSGFPDVLEMGPIVAGDHGRVVRAHRIRVRLGPPASMVAARSPDGRLDPRYRCFWRLDFQREASRAASPETDRSRAVASGFAGGSGRDSAPNQRRRLAIRRSRRQRRSNHRRRRSVSRPDNGSGDPAGRPGRGSGLRRARFRSPVNGRGRHRCIRYAGLVDWRFRRRPGDHHATAGGVYSRKVEFVFAGEIEVPRSDQRDGVPHRLLSTYRLGHSQRIGLENRSGAPLLQPQHNIRGLRRRPG